ncbi:MAG: hypothetical protein Kow0080_06970 [Candidatus Promineifilaceae bacterium]
MKPDFSWQTEEEEAFAVEEAVVQRKRPFLWLPALLVGVIVLGGWLLWRQVNRQAAQVESTVEADILASHQLILSSAYRGDRPLFANFISGREPWSSQTLALMEEGLLFNRMDMGLMWQPGTAVTPTITLSPTLAAATVVFTQTYTIDVGHGLTESVQLQHTAVYRKGPNRWLLAPPDEPAAAPATQTIESQRLRMVFPQTEAATAARLAVDLDTAVNAMCHLPGLTCPDTFQLFLFLDNTPETLQMTQLSALLQRGEPRLTLPAPSLVGMPVNEVAYEAVAHGYARLVVGAALAELVGYECCQHNVWFQALWLESLRQLGLAPSPLSPADWAALSRELPAVEAMGDVLGVDDWVEKDAAGVTPVCAYAAFLTQEKQMPIGQLLRQLAPDAAPFPDGLALGEEDDRAWWGYILASAPVLLPPVPFPAQDVAMACTNEAGMTLLTYEPETAVFSPQQTWPYTRVAMLALPDGGVALSLTTPKGESTFGGEALLWRAGQSVGQSLPVEVVDASSPDLTPMPVGVGENGRYLIYHQPAISSLPYTLLDVAVCLQDGVCDRSQIIGYPLWSPDGSRMLAMGNGQNPFAGSQMKDGLIFLGDDHAGGVDVTAVGTNPFWLDTAVIGYVTENRIVNSLDLETLNQAEVLAVQDLTDLLLEGEAAPTIDFVMPDPNQPERLILFVLRGGGGGALLAYDVAAGEGVQLALVAEGRPYTHTYAFSPDGQWLAVLASDAVSRYTALHVIHLQNGKSYARTWQAAAPAPLGWGADGWLTFVQNGVVMLVHPETGYETAVLPPKTVCQTAVWMTR